ncbi:MAG: ABC-F family ATP-binding cassette domain-containing protein [Chloroflexi bacterium]|nr:ABC-F family ATP-binding cassette domain-containing protein [Chloroflexota bacterium]
MSVLTAIHVSKAFGPDELFGGISVSIPNHAKIALVGPNGAGKTTLLNILIGNDEPTTGKVEVKRGLKIGFLPQRPKLTGNRTIWEEMLSAFEPLLAQQAKLTELEQALADGANNGDHDELLRRYGQAQEAFQEAGGYTYETEIKRVLMGLGFKPDEFSRPLTLLSGGQVTRALLARLLLESPELLVLDEPTNHLDINAVEWLEGYLKTWQGALLLVSHDRYFMDKVVNVIWELEFGEMDTYHGNYSHYVQQRQERHERMLKEFEAQQEFIKKEQDYIARNIAGQNTNQAKGRRRRLERLIKEGDWVKRRPQTKHKLHMRLEASRTGNEVFKTKGMSIGYPDADSPLFEVPEMLLMRGEVAAIIGPNGSGKSTFLKTILDNLRPLQGQFQWGARVEIGYFAQAHESLNTENTLLEEILQTKDMPISQARSYLATYLFTGDDVYRQINTLSGGERGRLALAKLSLAGANVLLLDEPTNHLDIASQEILQNVLVDYEGTILLVSHDRYLIDALATQIWAVQPGSMTIFQGSYHEYVTLREQEVAKLAEAANPSSKNGRSQAKPTVEKHPSGLSPFQRTKRLTELEAQIHKLEVELQTILDDLEIASASGKIQEVSRLGQRYTEAEAALDATMQEWDNLA